MLKLSEKQLLRFSAIAIHAGDSFGIYPNQNLPSEAKFYFTNIVDSVLAYSIFIDTDYFYYCIDITIFQVSRSIHYSLSLDEIALFLYLVFCKHETFNL